MSAPVFSCVSIAIVVARKGDKFCSTDEVGGWYLPAGRVDFGECFTTAAKRESMEEAGLDAALQGILRFEYGFGTKGFVRLRCVFAAEPSDPEAPLKQEADEETYGAEWLTIQDLKLLAKKDPGIIKKLQAIPRVKAVYANGGKKRGERLRSTETIKMFEWAKNGTTVFNSSLYRGYDGKEINNKVVRVQSAFRVVLVLKNTSTGKYRTVLKIVTNPRPFEEIALQVAKVTLKEKVTSLDGLCGILHKAPETAEASGEITFSFLWEGDSITIKDEGGNQVSEEMTFDEIVERSTTIDEAIFMAIDNVQNGIVAPLGFLVAEGSEHVVL